MCFFRRLRRLRPPSSSTSTEPRKWSLNTVPASPPEPPTVPPGGPSSSSSSSPLGGGGGDSAGQPAGHPATWCPLLPISPTVPGSWNLPHSRASPAAVSRQPQGTGTESFVGRAGTSPVPVAGISLQGRRIHLLAGDSHNEDNHFENTIEVTQSHYTVIKSACTKISKGREITVDMIMGHKPPTVDRPYISVQFMLILVLCPSQYQFTPTPVSTSPWFL
jgi:hypothetical protein